MSERQVRRYAMLAVVALVVAAWTGVLLRFGMVLGFPAWARNVGAMRHAHSHLMYCGWATVALFALIWADLPRHTGRRLPRGVGAQMAPTAGMALLSFPAFRVNGHGLTTIGSARLPDGLFWMAALANVVAALLLWPGVWREYAGGQLRVFYLHAFLLVWVSTALLGLLEARWLPARDLGQRGGGGRRHAVGPGHAMTPPTSRTSATPS